ncbi:hypothetical protein NS263_11195 [Curtobacterium oceanosedimentum]|uniref:Vitamin K epoxide reductase domain-containing protein n=1 Tax=Curtobacterium oceanosedimentum TaxID=465820 RepID=A0ABR5S676_9MICO|nr:hypothetical protein [Curtobacterium oceanosedimentum]KTR39231.1 hypothetical protein NS263_11195 [Curtobacterium oceanosedimentum]
MTFALLELVAVVTAVIVWFLYQFTLMVYTPCGGAATCSLGAQQVISVAFVLVVGSSIVLPLWGGLARRRKRLSFWWLPLVSVVSVVTVLALSWPLNQWAASPSAAPVPPTAAGAAAGAR